MSQKYRILKMLESSPNGVSCREFEEAQFGTYHKLASRISDLKKMGYEIVYQPSHTNSVLDARYLLIGRKELQDASNSNGKADLSPELAFPLLQDSQKEAAVEIQEPDISEFAGPW